jgi:hypothetical protein
MGNLESIMRSVNICIHHKISRLIISVRIKWKGDLARLECTRMRNINLEHWDTKRNFGNLGIIEEWCLLGCYAVWLL